MIEAFTKGILAILAIGIGASIIGWILYNEFVELLPGYDRPPLAGPLGIGPLMIGVGISWARQSIRYFVELGGGDGCDVQSYREDFIDKVVKWFFRVWGVLAVIGLISYLPRLWDGFPLVLAGLAVLVLIIVAAIIKEQWRRKKEGYFVDLRGGAEDGSVTYNEGGKILDLYFDRLTHTVYVPSDSTWERAMPDWARTRKEEIMRRITKHIKGWKCEETDRSTLIMTQS